MGCNEVSAGNNTGCTFPWIKPERFSYCYAYSVDATNYYDAVKVYISEYQLTPPRHLKIIYRRKQASTAFSFVHNLEESLLSLGLRTKQKPCVNCSHKGHITGLVSLT